MILWPETLWPGHFGQIDSLARVTFWPETLWLETVWLERQFGQWHFGQSDILARVTLWPERHFGQSDTLARDTLARVTFWPVFLASFGVPKDEKKFHGGDHREKFKKNNHHFSEKKVNYIFQIFQFCKKDTVYLRSFLASNLPSLVHYSLKNQPRQLPWLPWW